MADTGHFATTAETISEALTGKKENTPPFKTRGLKVYQKPATRTIQVVKREPGGGVVTVDAIIVDNMAKRKVDLSIHFDHDSASIKPESIPLLDELGRALTGAALRDIPISINGHTDSDGDNTYNLRLSLLRAQTVKLYLDKNFKLTSQIDVYGYGETSPLVPNTSPANKQINRRVEITRIDS